MLGTSARKATHSLGTSRIVRYVRPRKEMEPSGWTRPGLFGCRIAEGKDLHSAPPVGKQDHRLRSSEGRSRKRVPTRRDYTAANDIEFSGEKEGAQRLTPSPRAMRC